MCGLWIPPDTLNHLTDAAFAACEFTIESIGTIQPSSVVVSVNVRLSMRPGVPRPAPTGPRSRRLVECVRIPPGATRSGRVDGNPRGWVPAFAHRCDGPGRDYFEPPPARRSRMVLS